jgi:TPR repeat protein
VNARWAALMAAILPLASIASEVERGVALERSGAFARAADVFERAAAHGDAEARRHLGMMYYRGEGRQADTAKSIALLGQAADGGDAEAAILLGKMFQYGMGTGVDDAAAARWYTRGAELGASDSQFEASILYYKGVGVARDPAEAVKWWTLAMRRPSGFARAIRPQVESAESKMAPAEVAEGRERAQRWLASHP